MFKNILCAIDFSDTSARALTHAAALATQDGARLTVLHVAAAFEDASGSEPADEPGSGLVPGSHGDVLAKVRDAIFDPFEYLMLRHREQRLDLNFTQSLGKIAYHVACHQRVQKIGPKTKNVLELVPDTEVTVIERCSGHDGTYAVKKENYDYAQKICQPVVSRVEQAQADHLVSDCPMAGDLIEHGMTDGNATSAFALLRRAYGI